MKKNLLLFISIFTLGLTASAQVTISPSPISVTFDAAVETDVEAHATMTSNASETRIYRWVREEISLQEGWESAICDKNACYFASTSTKLVTFDAGEAGDLIVHVYPYGIEGSAEIKVCVTDTLDTSISTCNTYFFESTITGVTVIEQKDIKLFPNPTSGIFKMTRNSVVHTLFVYDLTGRVVTSFDVQSGEEFDISILPSGNYMIQMMDKEGNTFSTKLLQKK